MIRSTDPTHIFARGPPSSKHPHNTYLCIGKIRFAASLIHSRYISSTLKPNSTDPPNILTPGLTKTHLHSNHPPYASTVMTTRFAASYPRSPPRYTDPTNPSTPGFTNNILMPNHFPYQRQLKKHTTNLSPFHTIMYLFWKLINTHGWSFFVFSFATIHLL